MRYRQGDEMSLLKNRPNCGPIGEKLSNLVTLALAEKLVFVNFVIETAIVNTN
jgi:hypothetical protein